MTTRILKVMLWGREVGRLCIDPRRKLPYFEYNREWFETGLDISPLNASIKMPQNMRPIYGASEKIYQKLPPFLADSLPGGSARTDPDQRDQRDRISGTGTSIHDFILKEKE